MSIERDQVFDGKSCARTRHDALRDDNGVSPIDPHHLRMEPGEAGREIRVYEVRDSHLTVGARAGRYSDHTGTTSYHAAQSRHQ